LKKRREKPNKELLMRKSANRKKLSERYKMQEMPKEKPMRIALGNKNLPI